MTFIDSLILGIVQGLTEFFPISSSAHLKLVKWLLNIQDNEALLSFDLTCHFGTLFALIFFLKEEILRSLTCKKSVGFYILALVPLVPAYFLLKPIRILFSDLKFMGISLIITSLLLFLALRKKTTNCKSKKWKNVLWIGLMQTLALIPGISRSGSTISAGRLCGWQWIDAALFSFILSIPTILGGMMLEILKADQSFTLPISYYVGGFFSSFVVGFFAVQFVIKIYEKEKVKPFAWYCLAIGLITWAIFHG